MRGRARAGLAAVAMAATLTAGAARSLTTSEDPCANRDVGDVITFSSAAGDVSFPHLLHAEDLELECSGCHHEVHAKVLTMPHPEYLEDFWLDCATCHADRDAPSCPQSCSNCHHESPVTIADETLSSKVVIHESCWSCHGLGTGAEASSQCRSCHALPEAKQEG